MTQLILKDWRPGLEKISAVELLQERAGLSLTSAKECVDRLLKHETVIITMTSSEEAIELARKLRNIGVICDVENSDMVKR